MQQFIWLHPHDAPVTPSPYAGAEYINLRFVAFAKHAGADETGHRLYSLHDKNGHHMGTTIETVFVETFLQYRPPAPSDWWEERDGRLYCVAPTNQPDTP